MFEPAVPLSGVAGWRFLEATETAQRAAFNDSALLQREVAYFEENIGSVTTAQELVQDRTLLKVALGAFGLDEEIFKRAFLERILSEGTEDGESLANRFVDPRYAEFSRAFGFGDSIGAQTGTLGFASAITTTYKDRQFEIAVGEQDESMRLALTFRRQIEGYAGNGAPETTQWLSVLGNQPMRAVIEAAYNLPESFSNVDIDKQVETLQERTSGLFGGSSVDVFTDPANVDQLLNRFLVTQQVQNGPGPGVPGSAALTLLQSGGSASGITNLLLSGT